MKRYFLVLLGVGGLGVCRVLEAWGLNYSVFFLRLGRYLLSGYSAGKVGRDFYGFLYAVGGNDRVSVSLMGLVLFSRIR